MAIFSVMVLSIYSVTWKEDGSGLAREWVWREAVSMSIVGESMHPFQHCETVSFL